MKNYLYKFKKIIPQFLKNGYHLMQAVVSNFCFGFPSRKIKIIGITGTNGKTTISQMTTKILEEAGYKVAMSSTINFQIGDKKWVNKTKFTTLSTWQTQKMFRQAVKEKCNYFVMEVSSHSLDQYRTFGISFAVASISNITREHLDYHQTMEKYRQAKMKLFKQAKIAVVNQEIDNLDDFNFADYSKIYFYGLEKTKEELKKNDNKNIKRKFIIAKNIELKLNGSKYQVRNIDYELQLAGKFNIENALAAAGIALALNIDEEKIKKALSEIKGIAGRLEKIKNDNKLNIFIDYAVTPDSLEKLYQLIAEMKKQAVMQNDSEKKPKIISVFGSCGERDRGKRPIMGEIVSSYADYIIVTNEDPYHENPQQIIDEVWQGVKNKTENQDAWKIMDRREAIKKALHLAKAGDFILVTGKGAEETMAVGEKRISWSDKQAILEELKNT